MSLAVLRSPALAGMDAPSVNAELHGIWQRSPVRGMLKKKPAQGGPHAYSSAC
jgi:hypothetical protein